MRKHYLSVNVAAQALLLLEAVLRHGCCERRGIAQLALPYGVNREVALAFAEQCHWLRADGPGRVACTEEGARIASGFDGTGIGPALWRRILEGYIRHCRPAWAKRIPYGRAEAYLVMTEEEQRCFREAGLLESQADDVVDWWDGLAEQERTKRNRRLDDVGRRGERLTMAYEERRTGVRPDWRSIETNLSGYDILSRRSADDGERLLIEVKSSEKPLEAACALLSRREWEVAQLRTNAGRYRFYLWSLEGGRRLAVLTAEELCRHVPRDRADGRWETVRIPFAAFADRFVDVP